MDHNTNKKNTIASTFNSVLLDLITNLAVLFPSSILGQHIGKIESILTNPKYVDKYIGIFILKALDYKDQINNRDEKFFTRNDFGSDADGDITVIDRILQMKGIWCNLSKENKIIVFDFMSILCRLSDNYLLEEDD